MKHQILTLTLTLLTLAALLTACGFDPSAAQPQDHMAPSGTPVVPQQGQTAQDANNADPGPAASGDAAAQASTPSAAPAAGTSALSTQQAVDIALDHAQVNEADTSFLHTEQDHEHGRLVYEVEFYVGQTEYKYEIDASTGKILEMEQDHDH